MSHSDPNRLASRLVTVFGRNNKGTIFSGVSNNNNNNNNNFSKNFSSPPTT